MDPYHSFYALIVAGGTGARMGSSLPKQFMEMAGLPMMVHTLLPFAGAPEIREILLVLPAEHIPRGEEIVRNYFPGRAVRVVEGGSTRAQSVRKGLEQLPDDGIVAIHDGARPLVTRDLILRSFAEAAKSGAAVPIIHVSDTVRKFSGTESEVVDREMLRLVQTPQTFSLRIIKDAYKRTGSKTFTDDASVIAEAGYRFNFIDGDIFNLKVTTPEDLELASAILERRK